MALDLPPLRAPVIADLVPSLDDEHADVLAWLRTEYGWDLDGADASNPAWRLSRLLAWRTVLVRQAVADSVSQVSLDHASGAMLDHLGVTYYQLARLADEADDAYRARLAAAPALAAVGLTSAWYEAQARAVVGVSSAFVTGAARPDEAADTTPGAVTVAIRADGNEDDFPGGVPTAALLDAVRARVTAADVRQQTDRVSVVPAWRVPYDVTITLALRAHADAPAVRRDAEAALARTCRITDVIAGETSAALVAGAVVNPAAVRQATVRLQEVLRDRAQVTIQGIVVAAVAAGDAGTAITVALADPGSADHALEIAVAGTAITVALATNGSSALTTTDVELVSAWRTSAARRLASAARAGNAGAAVLAAAAAAPLVAGQVALAERTTLTAPSSGSLSCRNAAVVIA